MTIKKSDISVTLEQLRFSIRIFNLKLTIFIFRIIIIRPTGQTANLQLWKEIKHLYIQNRTLQLLLSPTPLHGRENPKGSGAFVKKIMSA